jgi:hypothetical protein
MKSLNLQVTTFCPSSQRWQKLLARKNCTTWPPMTIKPKATAVAAVAARR